MLKCESQRTLLVCIDSCTGDVPKGRIYCASGTDAKVFRSLTELLRIMENHLEEANFPQAFETIKSFGESDAAVTEEVDLDEKVGTLATFAVRVLFRQNASWQGEITWLDESRNQSFRSVLEMIFLMDSALNRKIPA